MNDADVLKRLRRFLLLLSLFLLAGTMFELWLVQHYQDATQWTAFGIGALGIIGVLAAMFRTAGPTIWILRVCMVIVIAGSAFGVYEHISNNIHFALEIQPNLSSGELVMKGLRGANPLLAPGTFTVAAILAIAATYRTPATEPSYVESSR
jgi:hypothetical protein